MTKKSVVYLFDSDAFYSSRFVTFSSKNWIVSKKSLAFFDRSINYFKLFKTFISNIFINFFRNSLKNFFLRFGINGQGISWKKILKIEFMIGSTYFWQIFRFWVNIANFGKYFYFWQIFLFLANIWICGKHFNFWKIFSIFWQIFSIFGKYFNFLANIFDL